MNLGKMAVMTPIVMNIVQGIFGKNINEIKSKHNIIIIFFENRFPYYF